MLLDRLVEHLPMAVRQRTCVVFDAKDPPAGVQDRFECGSIRVRFAVDYPEADDLIEKLILRHSAAKQLTVVSSDNRIKMAATRRGAAVWDSDRWIDRLVDGRLELAVDRSKWAGPSKIATRQNPPETTPENRPADARGLPPDNPGLPPDDRGLPPDDVERWLDEFGF